MRQDEITVAGQSFKVSEIPAMYIFDQDGKRMCLYDPVLDGGSVIYQVAQGMVEIDYFVGINIDEGVWRATNGDGTFCSSGSSPAEALLKLLWRSE